jgi:glycogen debranching enzyme
MHRWVNCLGAVLLLQLGSAGLAAPQPQSAVRKFAIVPSPIALAGDVRSHQYLGVLGRSAAWLGTETGEAELWVHPLKLASDFQLAFRIPDYVEPINGRDVARTVEIRPEITTITYSHATFTVRQHILAPLHEPGILILLEVETFRPLKVIVSFRTVLQYAWPGAFGGQYAFWDENVKAFVLSESLRQRSAFIGSPWASTASTHPAHALPDAPNTFVIPVDTLRIRDEFIPLVAAAGIAPRDSVRATYARLIDNAELLYREKLDHVTRLLENTAAIDTPNDLLDLAFAWSKINLDESLTCNPDLGCGLVAGWGPSGTSTRPGFGWFFGGDAAINSFAMSAAGLWDAVAQGLRFLATYQRDDGKIPHEISQAAARLPWFDGTFPYTYYHLDTTPFWIVAVWRYWKASGDDALLRELWPAVRRAYSWCLTRDTDGDGIVENGPENLGAIEVGDLGVGIHQDIYVAAVWIEALTAFAELAASQSAAAVSQEAAQIRERALRTLNEDYWREREGHHAFGILNTGGTNNNLTVWPATAAAFGLLTPARAESTLTKLAADSITADWGARILSTGSPLYDPMHYNNGAVWPFVTGFVVWGQYNYRRPWAAFPLLDALTQMTFDWARGRHPELLSGRYYRPLDTAVPQQFFATSMLLSPIMYGMLGWDPDGPGRRARLAPQLPPAWERVAVTNLTVGHTAISASLEQTAESFTAVLSGAGPPISIDLVVPIPSGSRDVAVTAGPPQPSGQDSLRRGLYDQQYTISLEVSETPIRVTVNWSGGLSVQPPTIQLEPGQASHGLRVLDFRSTDAGWRALVEGDSGRHYTLRLYGEQVRVSSGPATSDFSGGVNLLDIDLPAGRDRVTTALDLVPVRPQ